MSEAPQAWPVARAVLVGLIIAFAGVGAWTTLATLNASMRPDLPWAALAMGALMLVAIVWMSGVGPPRASQAERRYNLRIWRPVPDAWLGDNLVAIGGITLLIIALYPILIFITPRATEADLAAYPTTAYRISIVFMGALVSGVVEEAAFRGYMLSKLERFGQSFALPVMAIAFVLSHATHGLDILPLAPGLFVAGMLYGMLALRTGSIIPGAILHSAGDTSVTFFGTLGGDARLLFAP